MVCENRDLTKNIFFLSPEPFRSASATKTPVSQQGSHNQRGPKLQSLAPQELSENTRECHGESDIMGQLEKLGLIVAVMALVVAALLPASFQLFPPSASDLSGRQSCVSYSEVRSKRGRPTLRTSRRDMPSPPQRFHTRAHAARLGGWCSLTPGCSVLRSGPGYNLRGKLLNKIHTSPRRSTAQRPSSLTLQTAPSPSCRRPRFSSRQSSRP